MNIFLKDSETIYIYILIALSFLGTSLLPGVIAPVFLFSLLLLLLCFGLIIVKKSFFCFDSVHFLLLILFVWFILLSIFKIQSLDQVSYLVILVVDFYILYFISVSKVGFRDLLLFFQFFLVLSMLLGILEFFSGIHAPNSRHYDYHFDYDNKYIPTGTFYNENNFAVVMAIGGCLFCLRFFSSRFFLNKILYISLFFVSFFLIYLTDSRINLFSIFIPFLLIMYLGFCRFVFLRLSIGLKLFLMLTTFIFFVGLIVLVFYYKIELIVSEVLDVGSADAIRLELMRLGFDMAYSEDFIGGGPNQFEIQCTLSSGYLTRDICSPHNWIVELLANFGLLAVLIQLYVYFNLVVYLTLKAVNRKTSKKDFYYSVCFLSMLLVVILSGVSVSSIVSFTVVWVVLGIILKYKYINR